MNIKELRIGNLVQNKAGDVFEVMETGGVVTLWDGKYAENMNASELFPIPLTPEVLEGCGFGYDGHNDEWQLHIGEEEFDSKLDALGALYMTGPTYCIEVLIVDFLHRLQNIIFDLTGEELDVEGVKNLEHGT